MNSNYPIRPDEEENHIENDIISRAQDAARYNWGDYVALSYCWGSYDTETSRRIVLNGRFFRVTENLESALRFVRISKDLTKIPVRRITIWVDAISINQADDDEKTHEISRMKEIYGHSIGVLVHLGPEKDDSNRGIDVIKQTAAEVEQGIDRGQYLLENRDNPPEADREAYAALMKILIRPYWNRLWILQELAMSDSATIIGCGNQRILLKEVVLATRFIWHNLESVYLIAQATMDEFVALNSSTWVILFMKQLQELSKRLEDSQPVTYAQLQEPLFSLIQSAQAKLHHDKVFGLLAIMPKSVTSRMARYIDYNLPIEKLFVAFAKTIIEYTEDLDVIFVKNLQQTMVPSWAADWQLPPDRVSLLHEWHTYGYNQFEESYGNLNRMIEVSRQSRADGGRKSHFEILDDVCILTCSGVLIGKVDGLAADIPPLASADVSNCEHVQPQHQLNPYGDDEATTRALVHTLFANPVWGDLEDAALLNIPWIAGESYTTDMENFNVDDHQVEQFAKMHQLGWGFLFAYGYFVSFELFRRRLGHFRMAGKRLQDYFVHEISECTIPHDRIHLDLAKVVGGSLGRRLITLTTGHFGLAPGTIQPDDVVYVILGCSLPVVLRPMPGSSNFKVIGECYVEGYARGEGIALLDEGKLQLQKLIIC
jgi:hypothetical protein